jgi:hypothetical protein
MSNTMPDSTIIDRPCPSWCCDLQPGHGWDTIGLDGTDSWRGHGLDVGEHVNLFANERVCAVDESLPSTTDSPKIGVFGEDRLETTAEQARQHAAVLRQTADDLLKAADMLDQIEAATA